MYDFLNNFDKRMEKLSYSFLIDNKVSTLTAFKNNFSSIELINLVYSLMCFVLDKSLKDEECILSDMSSFLEDIASKYYNKSLSETECYDITHLIIYKILRNDGNPFIFKTMDYSLGKEKVFNYHLLQQKPSKRDNNKSTFSLTREGYRLILSALEVDERTQIDLNQMILELSLKKKNFSQGLMAVENLNNLITAQVNVINNFIYRTRENIFSIDQKEFEDNFIKNIEVLKEQNKKFDELKEVIILEEERLRKAEEEISKNNYESLKQLGRIKELLISITFKAGELIGRHFQFKNEYRKALEEASFYYNNKRIDIKEDLVKPVEKDMEKLPELFKLFNPLFKISLDKKFNINYIFNEQRLYYKEDDEDEVLIDKSEDEEENNNLREKNKNEYIGIVSSILEFVINNKETSLSLMTESFKNNKEKYRELVPSIRKLSEVLIELIRIGKIDINEMINEETGAYDNEEIEFDLRKILVDQISSKYSLIEIKTISFYKAQEGQRAVIFEEPAIEEGKEFYTREVLNCPDIIMKME